MKPWTRQQGREMLQVEYTEGYFSGEVVEEVGRVCRVPGLALQLAEGAPGGPLGGPECWLGCAQGPVTCHN